MKKLCFLLVMSLFASSAVKAQWQKLYVPGTASYNGFISAPDNETIYFYATDSSFNYNLMKSTDKGRTWTSKFQLFIGFFGTLNVQFINRDTGIVATTLAAFLTRDGGNTWDTLKSGDGEPFGYRLAEMQLGGTSLYANYRAGDTMSKIDVSHDLGATWQNVLSIPYSGPQDCYMSFTDRNHGYIHHTTYPGYLLHTSDGGATFDTLRSTVPGAERISSLRYTNNSTGIIGRAYQSYISTTGSFPEDAVSLIPGDSLLIRDHIQTGNHLYAVLNMDSRLLHYDISSGQWEVDTAWRDNDFLSDIAGMPDGSILVNTNTALYMKRADGHVGTKNIPAPNKITIYPNPSEDKLYMKYAPHLRFSSAYILDYSGRRHLSVPFPQQDIDISALQPGYYILELQTTDNKSIRETFMKL